MNRIEPWQQLPNLPAPAMSGRFAGVSGGALIVAGGSYFPRSLFDGGTKVVSDRIHVLDRPGGRWAAVGALERPLALGASVTDSAGLICLGGADTERAFGGVFRLRWTGSRVERDRLPDLPVPLTFLGAASLGTTIVAIGGAVSPTATEALSKVWGLDLAEKNARWKALPSLPGPGRIGAVVVAQGGGVYVFGGASLQRGPDGKPQRTYLRDSYRFRPQDGWKRLPDLPAPVTAAPGIAEGTRTILIFGGDDGANAARTQELKDRHPGFRRRTLAFDTRTERWIDASGIMAAQGTLPLGLVTTNAVRWGDRIVLPGGEDRPGHRSPVVLAARTTNREISESMNADTPAETVLFLANTEGYHTFRIPSLIPTKAGTLLAFAEGRKDGGGDAGAIDLVLRRSTDGGRTWGPLQVVWTDARNTCGNPCPVIDRDTGTIHLLMTHNLGDDHEAQIHAGTAKSSRTVWVTGSTDDGKTWAAPRDITATTKKPDWGWYATGPGIGIQIAQGPHKGRLVIPCDHSAKGTPGTRSHVLISDDGGASWQLGGIEREGAGNECQVAELSDGRLMLNMRNSRREIKMRGVSISRDGGTTWEGFRHDPALVEPICQASLLGATLDGRPALLFSNPADPEKRSRMTVRVSTDDGKTWPVARLLYDGTAAYSCLAAIGPDAFGCLYEKGVVKSYETITFARFGAAWLRG